MKRLLLTAFVVAGLAAPPAAFADDKKESTAQIAHIRLSGLLDETPAGEDPLLGALKEDFRAKLQRIRKAKDDPKVKALYLELDGIALGFFGYGKVHELRRAIAEFRKSGKKAYAYVQSPSDKEYLVALACDTVAMPESGELGLTGIRLEMVFFKDMLDKIGVKADFLRMGAYKSAAEPFTRNAMSKENREQYEAIVDDYFENGMVRTIIESRPQRNWTPDQVKEIIDNGPYTARRAKELGLVDELIYPAEFQERLKKSMEDEKAEVVRDYGKDKKDVDLSNPFAILKLLAPPKKKASDKPKVALIYGVGPIQTGKGGQDLFGDSVIGSDTMVKAIRKAAEDETVKAIVLRVDSPGGSAIASDLIWQALRACDKPVVASMGDIAGSGGYYISMAADKIYAEPGTLTGSIGVVGGKLVTKGLFDWVGVHTDVISRGKNSGIFTTERPFTEGERKAIEAIMDDIYDQFLDKTLKSRTDAGVKMTREELEKLAGGRVYTGRQAKEKGLVDELGTLEDAIAAAKKMAKLPEDEKVELLILPEPVPFLESLMEGGLSTRTAGGLEALLPLAKQFPELRGHLKAAAAFLQMRNERVWLMMPYRLTVR